MNNIVDILQKEKIPFEFIYHEKMIYSAQEGANYFKIQISQTAPILIIYTNKGFYALVISGSRKNVNFKQIEKILECDSARMATKKEVEQVTGFTAGNIPLLGLPLPYIVDKQLLENEFIYGGTGQSNCTLKVHPDALLKINQAIENALIFFDCFVLL